jgi:ATP-dependent Clp protease ATP-binding subunit ClpC
VPEPTVDETYQILLGLRERYEAHHKLTYTDEALRCAAKFSSQYISDRFLPDKVRELPALDTTVSIGAGPKEEGLASQ